MKYVLLIILFTFSFYGKSQTVTEGEGFEERSIHFTEAYKKVIYLTLFLLTVLKPLNYMQKKI